MSKIIQSLFKLHFIEEQASGATWIHQLHPLAKLIVTLTFIITVVSFEIYDLSGLMPLALYPVVVTNLAEVPCRPLLVRVLGVAPFIILMGIFNPLIDTQVHYFVLGFPITGGMISFLTLLLKYSLTLLAALLLLATTGFYPLAAALEKLRLPPILVMQLMLTYRYLAVMAEEVARVSTAYSLRAPGQHGVAPKVWGSLLGQILLRTYDRALRVHQAMMLRGYSLQHRRGVLCSDSAAFGRTDFTYTISWVLYFIAIRYVNIPTMLGRAVTRWSS
jgi:cobalt/nickel transport system permease protein